MFNRRAGNGPARGRFYSGQIGFTIIEVMIFLIVSVVVFGSAVLTISRQNSRTAFVQSVRDVELQLQDVFNDVENGYYPSGYDFSCSADSNGPKVVAGSGNEQGTNEGCIFIGKAVQFGHNGRTDRLTTSTIIGNRLDGTEEAQSLEDAKPTLLENDEFGLLDRKDVELINSGVEIENFYLSNSFGGGNVTFSGIGVVSGFAQQEKGTLQSGIVRTSFVPLGINGRVGTNDSQFLTQVKDSMRAVFIDTYTNAGGILCLQEAGGGRKAEIKIGVESQRLATSSIIDPDSGVCS